MLPQNGSAAITQRDRMSSSSNRLVQQQASGRVARRLALLERRQFVERESDSDVEQQSDTGRPPVQQTDVQRTLTTAIDSRAVCKRVEQ